MISLFIGFTACKKDFTNDDVKLAPFNAITIQEVRSKLASYGLGVIPISDREACDVECEGPGLYFNLDWTMADSYYDDDWDLYIMEIPILDNNLSKVKLVEDTAIESSSEGDYQRASLIVTQNAMNELNIAILKISPTTAYLNNFNVSNNSFRQLDINFEGRIAYYNLSDSLYASYIVKDSIIREGIIDSAYLNDSIVNNHLEARWRFCVLYYIYIKCTGTGHTWEQRLRCDCGKTADCTPPLRLAVLYECGGPTIDQSKRFGFPPPPIPDPGSTTGSGGSSGGNNYKMDQFNDLCEFQLNNYSAHHRAIISICYKEPDFNFCVLRELSKNAEEGLFDDCWKAYYMDKYDLTEEEWEDYNNIEELLPNPNQDVTPILPVGKNICRQYLLNNQQLAFIDNNGKKHYNHGIYLEGLNIELEYGGVKKKFTMNRQFGFQGIEGTCPHTYLDSYKECVADVLNASIQGLRDKYNRNKGNLPEASMKAQFEADSKQFKACLKAICERNGVPQNGEGQIKYTGSPSEFLAEFNGNATLTVFDHSFETKCP